MVSATDGTTQPVYVAGFAQVIGGTRERFVSFKGRTADDDGAAAGSRSGWWVCRYLTTVDSRGM